MKRMKKIMALMLAAIMMMAMSVTAFAAEGATGAHTLTVNVKSTEPAQDLKGQTINLYKLFDVTESKSGETTNYAYTVNNTYKAALASVLKIDETSKDEDFAAAVTKLGSDNATAVQKFANDFTAEALTKNLSATANSGKIKEENKTSYTFNDLAAGYYLVYVTGGKDIQSSLVTVDAPTNTVNLKTEAPSITKTANKETAEIGQVVTYTVTGAIPDTTGYDSYVYKINDELTKGLDFVNDANGTACTDNKVAVKVAFTDGTDASTAPTTAALATNNSKKMSLDLSTWVRANQGNKGKAFTVTYYAKVNKDAEVTNNNKASLEYGNNPSDTTTTTPSEAKTNTYPLDIKKINKKTSGLLAGAKFSLYRSETDAKNGENAITVTGSNGNYVVDPVSTTTEFVSVEKDLGGYNLRVNGLEAKDYWLVETQAPEGFNKLTDPIKVTITKDGDTNWTVKKNNTAEDDKIIDVENSTGSLLPSTGGRGAIAFAVIAAILVFGVAVSFIRDKRKEA
ncbi:SpaH/EbpB family LPXTG-anchored major pilin [Dorea amylophila]|jgi:fimbrial isopeptide formation D2 family protein/LPXTG-motif cell wall-anchored protein|uniref:SpaH/EbpB family LPXTG-anchored major pilin n=1 Tax=Dorea amylophila TaxID=2981789 RepID=UPI0022E215A1|nr:SpaH/EbpB family LPXTG-anchored major pilin [Dorea amylophila]